MRKAHPPTLFGREVRAIHCVGVGGAGLAPLAIYLARSGWLVSGEDDALGEEVAAELVSAAVRIGARPEACDLVVRSSAVPLSHASVRSAKEASVGVVRRGELLAEVTAGSRLVAVCGSHGKTTTTAMLIWALRRAGFSAGYIGGGFFNDSAPAAAVGSTDWVVAEIDESDGTIDLFSPELTVLVNLDWDHADRYRSPDHIEATFAALCARTRSVVLASDASALSLRIAPSAVSFGKSGEFTGHLAHAEEGRMSLSLGGRFAVREALVRGFGEFNASNAIAALAAAQLMGASISRESLADYAGVRRRQAVILEDSGVTVVEDYAHHPAEIRALLAALRSRVSGNGRLVAIFQPHRYSRTAQFKAEFAAALSLADRVHLLDVYPAGERPVGGGTSADIYAEIRKGSPSLPASYIPGVPNALAGLFADATPGSVIAFVGAGDVDRIGRNWVGELARRLAEDRRWQALAGELTGALSRESKVSLSERLGPKTTLGVGGPARLYVEPANAQDLRLVAEKAEAAGVPLYMLGRGSNLVVPDEGVDGLVVSLSHRAWSGFERLEDGRVRAGAGLRLKNLCGLAAAAGLAGFEFLEGIPGSLGGALRMNAGAMGGWMFDVVDEVEVLLPGGEFRKFARPEMTVDYRSCAELEHAVALSAILHPASVEAAAKINAHIEGYRRRRKESQPREPSAGCIFKNPTGTSAGRLIDESGLKGARVGDAEVSAIHANFIINRGNATSADVLELVRRIRARVREARGVELEPEVLLFGKKWRDVL